MYAWILFLRPGRCYLRIYARHRRLCAFSLIPDRQATDSFAGRCKYRIAERGCDRRYTRLADAAQRHAPVGLRDQMHADITRRLTHSRDAILVKVILLRSTVFEGDLAKH